MPTTVAPETVLLIVAAYLLGSLSGRRLLHRFRNAHGPMEPSDPPVPETRFVAAAHLTFDAAKGFLAAWVALRLAPVGDVMSVTGHGYAAAFAAVLGHAFPLWHRFRGTAGAATLAGGLLVLWPLSYAVALSVGLLAFLWSGHVAVSRLAGVAVLPLLAWWGDAAAPRTVFAVAVVVLMVLLHVDVLMRLRAGTEPRFARARLLHRWRRG